MQTIRKREKSSFSCFDLNLSDQTSLKRRPLKAQKISKSTSKRQRFPFTILNSTESKKTKGDPLDLKGLLLLYWPKTSENQSISASFLIRKINKTRTPQVGAISKAQKAQNIFFWKKNLKFSKKNFFRKMSDSAEKCKRGDPF